MMKVYAHNDKIDPGVNPFIGQQLVSMDDYIINKPAEFVEPKVANSVSEQLNNKATVNIEMAE